MKIKGTTVTWQLVAMALLLGTAWPYCQEGTLVEGSWKGLFMETFQLTLDFRQDADGACTGSVLLSQDGQQLQNDPLSNIRLEGDSLNFLIPAKSTAFAGRIDGALLTIKGQFTFPDGTRHPVFLEKAADEEYYAKGSPLDKARMKSDLAFLYQSILDLHPAPYAYAGELDFRKLYQETDAAIDQVESMERFLLLASRLTDAVGCSHTGLRPPEEWIQPHDKVFLPVKLWYSKGKLWCLGSFTEGPTLPAGAEVRSINGQTAGQIVEELFTLIPAEGWNTTTKPALLNKEFEYYYAFLNPEPVFEFSFRAPNDDAVQSRTLRATDRATVKARGDAKVPDNIYRQDVPLHFYMEETMDAAVLRLPTFGIPNQEAYLEALESIFEQLERQKIRHLILDLRGNQGGHPVFAAILFSYLTTGPFTWLDRGSGIVEELAPLYHPMEPAATPFGGQLYLLEDGACLSTAGHLIAHLQVRGMGVMVGEKPGSFASCNDNSIRRFLPYSQIQVNIARSTFTIAFPEEGEPAIPVLDYELEATLRDQLEGRDAVLEACFQLIREQE